MVALGTSVATDLDGEDEARGNRQSSGRRRGHHRPPSHKSKPFTNDFEAPLMLVFNIDVEVALNDTRCNDGAAAARC